MRPGKMVAAKMDQILLSRSCLGRLPHAVGTRGLSAGSSPRPLDFPNGTIQQLN
jgi:hypothetical protein